MRQICFGVAMSLDGYIAGPLGEHDWIVIDPGIDVGEMQNRFDTYLIGRKTFEAIKGMSVPLLPPPAGRATLRLRRHRVYERTGTVGLEYDVVRAPAARKATRRKPRAGA